jgi:hypothetical protein
MPKRASNSGSLKEIPSSRRGLKDGYERVTFIVKEDISYKLNCIASIEDVFLKEIVNSALEAFISEWEKKNGKVGKTKSK